MANIIILDTETIGLDDPSCYNLGYIVMDYETGEVHAQRDFTIKEVFTDKAHMARAFYANKAPIYKERRTPCKTWARVMRQLARDIKKYRIEWWCAYNVAFDDRVINWNCDKRAIENPLNDLCFFDLLGTARAILGDEPKYEEWAHAHNALTATGRVSFTAENVARYLFNPSIVEEHTALSDSKLEGAIYCAFRGCALA